MSGSPAKSDRFAGPSASVHPSLRFLHRTVIVDIGLQGCDWGIMFRYENTEVEIKRHGEDLVVPMLSFRGCFMF
jgi:hypothetical protein